MSSPGKRPKKGGASTASGRGSGPRGSHSLGASRGQPVHNITFNYTLGELEVYGETDPTPGGAGFWTFRLSDVPQASSWQSLFDLYKINWVEMTFIPTANMSAMINSTEPPGGTNPVYYLPNIHTFVDYTNTSAPTTGVTYAMSYSSYKRNQLVRPVTRRLVPRASLQASQPGTITPTSGLMEPSSNTWFACSYPGLRHAGMGAWVDPVSSASVALKPLVVQVYVKMNVSFKNIV